MSDIDFQIVDVENELDKRQNEPTDPNGCGGCAILLLLFAGLLIIAFVLTAFLVQK